MNADKPGDFCRTLNKSLDLPKSLCKYERPTACQSDRVSDGIRCLIQRFDILSSQVHPINKTNM